MFRVNGEKLEYYSYHKLAKPVFTTRGDAR
jgi:hypothetical protein